MSKFKRWHTLEWTNLRIDAYIACNGICWGCGGRVTAKKFSVDHIKPRSIGGKDQLYNLRLMHRTCHEARHGKPTMTPMQYIYRATVDERMN